MRQLKILYFQLLCNHTMNTTFIDNFYFHFQWSNTFLWSMSLHCNWWILWLRAWSFSSSKSESAFEVSPCNKPKSDNLFLLLLAIQLFLMSSIFLERDFAWLYMWQYMLEDPLRTKSSNWICSLWCFEQVQNTIFLPY